jgi:hypothetical protein
MELWFATNVVLIQIHFLRASWERSKVAQSAQFAALDVIEITISCAFGHVFRFGLL